MDPVRTSRLEHLPVTLFGSAMGLSGLSIAYLRADHILGTHLGFGTPLLYATSLWFLFLSAAYLLKLLRYPAAVRAEFNHPVRINFFPAWSISVLLLSIGYLDPHPTVSRVLWLIGTPLHLIYCLHIMHTWFYREFAIKTMNPAWFIPVVGTILVPVAGVAHGFREISWFFFSIGTLFWIVLLTIVINRILFHGNLAAKFLPTLFILIPPPAVGFIALVKLTGGDGDVQRMFFHLALFFLLLMTSMIGRMVRVPYYVSWWAYTFPLASITIASMLMFKLSAMPAYRWLAFGLLGITTLIVLIVTTSTVRAARRGEICTPED
ncbi:SLAC1 anion channel family protein [bacterium]|nr:SLAC1 anion channel family protein [bacterium]